MSWIQRWIWSDAATVLDEVLTAAGVPSDAPDVALVGRAALADALAERRRVIGVAPGKRATATGPKLRAPDGALPLRDEGLAALIAVGLAARDDWRELAAEWLRVVRVGGVVAWLDSGRRQEASRRALNAGLVDLQQRVQGRKVVTLGRVPLCAKDTR